MIETLAIKSDFERFDEWIHAFSHSDLKIVDWDALQSRPPEDKATIDYALVWKPAPGSLAALPNLKIIFSIGAGIDHLEGNHILPTGIPVVRMVEQELTAGMVEYVVYQTLHYHRFMPQYRQQQSKKQWNGILQVSARQRTVGIMGLGELGKACADALNAFGFNLSGWSRSEKHYAGITSYFGDPQLQSMLSKTDILICLLPLTPATHGILNKDTLSALPQGAYLVNAGRGQLQIESDIIELLNVGHLAGAALDVFETEPLPKDNPLWSHPAVTITPHVASMTLPATSAIHVYNNIQKFRKSQPMTHVADMQRGY